MTLKLSVRLWPFRCALFLLSLAIRDQRKQRALVRTKQVSQVARDARRNQQAVEFVLLPARGDFFHRFSKPFQAIPKLARLPFQRSLENLLE